MSDRHVILISGKDSACTAIVQQAAQPELNYEYIFNPTGAEVPEIFAWIDKMSNYLGQEIKQVGDDLEALIQKFGILPSARVRFCTKYGKIKPLENYLDGDETYVYYGLRYDEPQREGYSNKAKKGKGGAIIPVYPLRTARIGLPGVWKILEMKDLLPPQFFWQEMYDRVEAIMGENISIAKILKPWDYNALFAWRSRPNCYFCFFQRQYEFIGLLDHHPDLFWKAYEIEMTTGAEGFTWREGYTLKDLAEKAEEKKQKRAEQISRTLYRLAQMHIFSHDGEEISLTSCGLLCGK